MNSDIDMQAALVLTSLTRNHEQWVMDAAEHVHGSRCAKACLYTKEHEPRVPTTEEIKTRIRSLD